MDGAGDKAGDKEKLKVDGVSRPKPRVLADGTYATETAYGGSEGGCETTSTNGTVTVGSPLELTFLLQH